jgi:DNA polymerase elongation subunit (family B)
MEKNDNKNKRELKDIDSVENKSEEKDLIFQILEWDDFHEEDDESKKKFTIRLFGRTKEQKTIYLQVEDYKPFFYVELKPEWRRRHIEIILKSIEQKLYSKSTTKEELIASLNTDWKIETKYKFYGFTNYKKFNFVKFVFNDFDAMRAYANAFDRIYRIPLISKEKIKFELYESNLLPILRFMHIKELDAVGWVSVPKSKVETFDISPTCCELNYKTNYNMLNKIDDCVIEKFKIAAFDLECTSEDGNFPQPERDGDKIIQIGITFSRYGESECYEKVILCLKETNNIPDAEVIWYETEQELLLGFTKLIRQKDPDIITGYNIFGFDFKYLMKRANKLGIYAKFSRLSRVNNEISEWIERERFLSSISYYKMTGRVIIDLMNVVKKEYNLTSYKLDYVASYFIREGIDDIININNTFRINTKNTFGLTLDQYITITYIEGAVDNSYENGKKFKIKELGSNYIIADGNVNTNEFMGKGYKVFWCQAKDDISPSDIFRMFEGTPQERSIIAKYCLQDCTLCNKIMAKLQIINNYSSMANVCSVPLSFLFFRGQGVKIFSLVAKKCRQKNHLIKVVKKKEKPDLTKLDLSNAKDRYILERIKEEEAFNKHIRDINKDKQFEDEEIDDEEDGYEGAIVFVPEPKVYYEPIPVLDFASLYPNSMIFLNLSHECFVDNKEYDNLPGYIYHTITYKNNNNTITTCRFAEKQDGSTKGIIPEILIDLLTARKKYKKLMGEEKDPFKKAILDSLQLAYKITANSVYGQCGAPVSPIYMKQIAASTTATGRKMLIFSRHFIENIFSKLVTLALDDKEEFYKEIEKYYQFYPHDFQVEEINPETLQKELTTMYVHTVKNTNIPEHKFVKDFIGYECDNNFINSKKESDTDNDYKKLFSILCDIKETNNTENYEKKFIKELLFINPFEREEFKILLENYIINGIGTSTKLYDKYELFWNKFDITDNKILKSKFLNLIHNFNDKTKTKFFEKLTNIIDNLGYLNKKQFFDKFYITMNKILKGHHISAQIIYGDTDSVFFKCTIQDNKTKEILKNKKALEIAINLGIWGSIMICTILPSPMAQEYEKVLWPFAIQGKKRYVGNLYEKNPNKFYQKSMGIETKRRDNAPIVKYVCNGIINQILNNHCPEGAYNFTLNTLQKIITGKYTMDKFIITKTLKGPGMTKEEVIKENLKPKEKRFYVDRTSIVHAVLADRIASRTPGNKPQSGDRIPYVYIEIKTSKKQKILQGERVENPEYIINNNLKIDYLFYITNQIMKPALKFLDLIIYDAGKLFDDYIIKETNRKKCMMPIAFYEKSNFENLNNDNKQIINTIDNNKQIINTIDNNKQIINTIDNNKQIDSVNFDDFMENEQISSIPINTKIKRKNNTTYKKKPKNNTNIQYAVTTTDLFD